MSGTTFRRKVPDPVREIQEQGRQWSRAAARYDDLFLDALHPDVKNPILDMLDALPERERKTVADLGCGPGALLPRLVGRFGRVIALDFAPAMIAKAKKRLGADSAQVEFETRSMHDLAHLAGQLDVAVAINSVVMPDVRIIDKTLRAIRESLAPGGIFLGVVPSIDAIHYHTMLLLDQALDRGLAPEEAERTAAFHAEHHYYDFAFGRFQFQGLRQKFWQPFELRHRLNKAGFTSVAFDKVLYPWDENLASGADFTAFPQSWDWAFRAEA